MAKRKTTQQWEQIKHRYTKCLCYSKERGLYTTSVREIENSQDFLYRPQGYVGYVDDKILIPGTNVEIVIMTNFGYMGASYHKASISIDNRRLLDFDLSKIYVLNRCSVITFDVPLYDWDGLFDKIIDAYKLSLTNDYTNSCIAYIDEISNILDKDEIFIRGNIDNQKTVRWEGNYILTLFAGQKIQDLLKGFEVAKVSDSVLIKHTMNLCRMYISAFKSLALDYEDSRVSQLSEALQAIHSYMCKNGASTEYLKLILDKVE